MTCPITADRDEFRGAVTEREAALVEALKAIADDADVSGGLAVVRTSLIIKARLLARAHTATDAGGE